MNTDNCAYVQCVVPLLCLPVRLQALISTHLHLPGAISLPRYVFFNTKALLPSSPQEIKSVCVDQCTKLPPAACLYGKECSRLHVKPSFFALLNEGMLQRCCFLHGDSPSWYSSLHREAIVQNGALWVLWRGRKVFVPIQKIAWTRGSEAALDQGYKPPAELCHARLRCTCVWGRQCERIHVCPAYLTQIETATVFFGNGFRTTYTTAALPNFVPPLSMLAVVQRRPQQRYAHLLSFCHQFWHHEESNIASDGVEWEKARLELIANTPFFAGVKVGGL